MTEGSKKPRIGVRKALSLSFVQTLVSLVFGFGSIIIVSHLLTPAEIGVFSVAAGLVALIQMLRDFGVTEFLIQEEHLDEAKIRTVFTINLVIAWTLAIALFTFSGMLGRFYRDPGVADVLRVLSAVFILLPFGAVAQTLMKRDLEFGKLIKIQLGQNITRSCFTVGLAFAGFSYMSMAWSSLLAAVVMVAGCMAWGWQYRVSGLSLAHWRRVLHFGSNRTVADVATQLGNESANLVIGRVLGMAATGLYSRGFGIVNMFRSNIGGAITTVAFPAFAREHRESGTAPELFLQSRAYLTGIAWPFFGAGALLAFPLIRILFGSQWDAAVPLMRWLCLAALIDTPTYQCDGFLVAVGRVRTATRISIQYQLARIVLTAAAAFYSLEAVAAVQVLVYAVAVLLYYGVLRQYDALSIRKLVSAMAPSAIVAAVTWIVPAIVVFWPGFVHQHMIAALCAAVVGGCIGWLVAAVSVHHPLIGEFRRLASRFPRLHRIYG